MRCLADTLMENCVEENSKIIEEFNVHDVVWVEIDNNEYLRSFSTFYDRAVIMFFIDIILFL